MTHELIGKEIKVHNHGFVKLVDFMGSDQRIVEAARISYDSPSKGEEQDRKLLHYLYRNKHTSPFEMVKVSFNIKMEMFVMRQYIRHRMQNLNEVSARYTQLPSEFYIPEKWRKQDTKNKQGSLIDNEWIPTCDYMGLLWEGDDKVNEALGHFCDHAYDLYTSLIKGGVAREMARMVLPVNIYTEIYCTWDLKNLLHFISLRDDSHAQSEIQDYAKVIKEILNELFPVTMEAYEKYKWVLSE